MAQESRPETRRRRHKPTKQGTVLSEELIVDTALRVVGQHGPHALTARRVGTALGADPSSIYRYFASMDDLLLAIADELIGRAQQGWAPTGDWRNDLREIGLRIHAVYLDHPQAGMLAAHRTTGRAHEVRAVEAILGVLRGIGLPDADAVSIYHAFVDQSLGFAALDAAALALPAAAQAGDDEVWRANYAQVDSTVHPNIAATASLLAAEMRQSGYELALELLLDAVAGRCEP